MKTFPLRIGTPDGLLFEGDVERVICRSITGDMAVLAGHINVCTALGMGEAQVVMPDGSRRAAACIGGMLSMMNGVCRVLATTWEWKEEIDEERAQRGTQRFFEEYEHLRRTYEDTDKAKFENYDENAFANANRILQETEREKDVCLGNIAAKENALKRLLDLREKYREQAKELVEKERRLQLCDQLRQLLRGNRFLEFIASEYLQEICVTASKTLLSLTGGRYFLQYDKDFKVGDNLDGGNLRAVKTLSGGETFLVSLSLALSLSGAICMKSLRPIEFFFLDEGFGTLDEKLVETVMDVLGKLSKTFAVGLISHVEELKHRIDNKILVTGATETHGSVVRVETF